MPFWRAFYHLVWATKNREPLITPAIEPRLHAYIVHQAARLGVYVYAIGGWIDHVHLVVAIPPHVSVADLVKHLKGGSSHDINQQGLDVRFGWQRGYGVLSLGQRQKADAEAYVRNQKEHHGSDTVNAWMEHCSELDEGPEEPPAWSASRPAPATHESRPDYGIPGEPPF